MITPQQKKVEIDRQKVSRFRFGAKDRDVRRSFLLPLNWRDGQSAQPHWTFPLGRVLAVFPD